MVVILKDGADSKKVKNLTDWLENQKISVHKVIGEYQTILGLIGDTSKIDIDLIQGLDIVEKVKRISEPYKNANRKFHPDDTIIDVGGLELLLEAKKETGMPIVTEIMDASHIDLFENVDIIQVGARNMQNFELLKELGRIDKPIFLKRGLCATLQEFLMSAEYIMAEGNQKVILCERGIRTFETATRNTLDLSAVAMLHEMTHLPVVVDPSHASGIARLVKPMSFAAAACGADGLMIEVHNDPAKALCDGPQALRPEEFAEVTRGVNAIRETVNNL